MAGSTATVREHLDALVEAGELAQESGRDRGYRIPGGFVPGMVPILGRVHAGALHQAKFALCGLIVDTDQMRRNLGISRGLIVAELTIKDADDLLEMLCLLDTQAACLAAQRRTPAQAERLVELVQPFEPEYRANHAYRTATAGACGPGFGAIEAMVVSEELGRGLVPELNVGVSARNEVGDDVGHEWVLGPSLSLELPIFDPGHADIARIQADLRDYKSRKDKGLAQDFRRLAEVKAELAAVDKQLAAARRRAALAGAPENPIPEERVLSAEATYARLVRDVETYRTAYEKIHDREVEAQINEELSKVKGNLAARVEDPAKRAPGPRGVSRKLMTLICLALGFLAGALIALVRSLTDPHIYTVFDLARASKLPVLGRVPRRDGSGGSALSDVSEEVGQSGNSVRLELPPDPSGPGRLALERERSGISMSPLATGAHSSISSLPGGAGAPAASSISSLGQAAPVPPRSGSPVTQPLPTLGGVPQPASGSDASGCGEWGSDYMVVYSSGREGTHPGRDLSGLRQASELAPGTGDLSAAFTRDYTAAHQATPDQWAALGFTGVELITAAMQQGHDSATRAAISS